MTALKREDCDFIYHEKKSAVRHPPELEKLLNIIGDGDILIVYKPDRPARSLNHLLTTIERLNRIGAY